MSVLLIDSEFMQYWSKLTVLEMRKKMIEQEREKYLRGEGASYSWEEVKQMAVNKEKRHAI